METTKFFKQAIAEVNPRRSPRVIKLESEKVKTAEVKKADGTGKRGRKKVTELRVIKYVRLEPKHLAILNEVKRNLKTRSTSRAIKFCIDQWRSHASTIQKTDD